MIQKKNRHHYVPRAYLKNWASPTNLIAQTNIRDGKVITASIDTVGIKKGIYDNPKIGKIESIILNGLFKRSNRNLKDLHSHLLSIFEWLGICQHRGIQEVSDAMANFLEDYYMEEERDFAQYMEHIKERDYAFINNKDHTIRFLRGICLYYTRTRKFTNQLVDVISEMSISPEIEPLIKQHSEPCYDSIIKVIALITADNVAASLYQDRVQFTLHFLINKTQLLFITSDQPVCNISDNPEELAFYFPISPNRAILLCPKNSDTFFYSEKNKSSNEVILESNDDINKFNRLQRNEAYQFIFSTKNRVE